MGGGEPQQTVIQEPAHLDDLAHEASPPWLDAGVWIAGLGLLATILTVIVSPWWRGKIHKATRGIVPWNEDGVWGPMKENKK